MQTGAQIGEDFLKEKIDGFTKRIHLWGGSALRSWTFTKASRRDCVMRIKDQKGGSLVEFAIIAPLLFVIFFGIIEFGILLYDKALITNASREGARAGIVFSTPQRISDAEITQVVTNYCEDHLISFGTSSISTILNRTGNEAGDILTVTVNYSFRFLVFSNVLALIGGNVGNLINLHAETVMRLE